jgi:predicted amidohydrolase YtcJ
VITREEAARILTAGPAMAEWAEAEKGRIAPGMLADFAVLSQDIFTVPAAALPATRSELTVIGGRIAYSSGAVAPSTVHAGARR